MLSAEEDNPGWQIQQDKLQPQVMSRCEEGEE
jgi:hypothetical protein